MKAPITTHILDLQYGKPASGICVSLFNDKAPERVCQGTTDADSDILIAFKVESVKQHYHVPLLLSAFGYSTYRGS